MKGQKEHPLFTPAPFFMARIPLFPSEIFHRLLDREENEKTLQELYQSSSLFREAIAIASPPLYEALGRLDALTSKAKKQAFSSLLKYALRMATRATPFGLFSCVSEGKFTQHASGTFEIEQIQKSARPDMEWLFSWLNQFFSNKEVVSHFSYRKNPLLTELNGRIVLPYTRRKVKEEVSIRASTLVEFILSQTNESISFHSLLDRVMSHFSHLERKKVEEVVYALIQEDILYPAIFPSLLSNNPFNDLLVGLKQHLPNHPSVYTLCAIDQKIQEYNASLPGKGESKLLELEKMMGQEISTKTFLQVDSIYRKEIFLPHSIIEELQRSTELLWLLSKRQGFPHLRTYHQKFLEKYGTFRIVPIEELLDEVKGLGYPDHTEKPQHEESQDGDLYEMWAEAVYHRKREIELTEAFFEKKRHHEPKDFAPTSFDLFCEVIADSPEKLDDGDFQVVLHPITGAGDGCSTFGRFLPILGEETQRHVAAFLRREEELKPSAHYAECSFFPSSARSANVAINPNLRKEHVELGFSEEGLALNDICIGATENFLYCVHRRSEKQLIFSALNALNPDLAPPVIRFLREVSKDSCRFLLPFDWKDAHYFPYRPRIRYKKTILAPASWQVTLSVIGAEAKESHDTIVAKLQEWAKAWHVPNKVMMALADNKILLDLSHPLHLREVAHALKNNDSRPVLLTENRREGGWIKSAYGSHFSEFVIPFVRTHKDSENIPIPPFTVVSPETRFELPGSDWFYLKIYLPKEAEISFLLHCVVPLIQKNYGVLERWFYVRYRENGYSLLRLRLKLNEGESKEAFLENLYYWATPLIHQAVMRDFSLGTYEREVERYGGMESVKLAEKIFCADSELALWIINLIANNETELPNYAFVALSVMEILKCFGLSIDQQKKFFDMMVIDRNYLEGFREWRDRLVPAAMSIFEKENTLVPEVSLSKLREAIQAYKEGNPSVSEKAIRSILHMHCNRVMGIDNTLEFRSYLFAQKTITIARNMQKKTSRTGR